MSWRLAPGEESLDHELNRARLLDRSIVAPAVPAQQGRVTEPTWTIAGHPQARPCTDERSFSRSDRLGSRPSRLPLRRTRGRADDISDSRPLVFAGRDSRASAHAGSVEPGSARLPGGPA